MRETKYFWHILVASLLLLSLSSCFLSSTPTPTSEYVLAFPDSAAPPPEDVLDQIAVFGGGGEDAKPTCMEITTPCMELVDNDLFIRGESPYQELIIVSYVYVDDGYSLFNHYSQWEIKLGADNTLYVSVQNMKNTTVFIAYDSRTLLPVASSMDFDSPENAIKQKNEAQCPPNIETHLCINCTGIIINDHIRGNGLPNGTLFDVINGPNCVSNSIQWYVEIQEGQFPMARSQGSEFWKITLDGQSFLRAAGHTWVFEKMNNEWLAEKVE